MFSPAFAARKSIQKQCGDMKAEEAVVGSRDQAELWAGDMATGLLDHAKLQAGALPDFQLISQLVLSGLLSIARVRSANLWHVRFTTNLFMARTIHFLLNFELIACALAT